MDARGWIRMLLPALPLGACDLAVERTHVLGMRWGCVQGAVVMILCEDSCLWRREASVTTRSLPTCILRF